MAYNTPVSVEDHLSLTNFSKLNEIPKGYQCTLPFEPTKDRFSILNSYTFRFKRFSNIEAKDKEKLLEPVIVIRFNTPPSRDGFEYDALNDINLENRVIYTYSDMMSLSDRSFSRFASNFTMSVIFPEAYYIEGSFEINVHKNLDLKYWMIFATAFIVILAIVIIALT